MEQLGPFLVEIEILVAAALFVAVLFFGRRFVRRLPPMSSLSIQALLLACTIFTVGIALVSIRDSVFVLFGVVLMCGGLSIFLPEKIIARLSGIFFLLLLLSLLAVLQRLRGDEPFIQPQTKMSLWFAFVIALVWAAGIVFAWQRWYSGRARKDDDA
jgi:hypothetical protein